MSTHPDPALIDDLVLANHILVNQGVLDGFGHISVRDPANPQRFFIARSMAPALVQADDIVVCDLDSNVIDERGRASRPPHGCPRSRPGLCPMRGSAPTDRSLHRRCGGFHKPVWWRPKNRSCGRWGASARP